MCSTYRAPLAFTQARHIFKTLQGWRGERERQRSGWAGSSICPLPQHSKSTTQPSGATKAFPFVRSCVPAVVSHAGVWAGRPWRCVRPPQEAPAAQHAQGYLSNLWAYATAQLPVPSADKTLENHNVLTSPVAWLSTPEVFYLISPAAFPPPSRGRGSPLGHKVCYPMS